MSQTTPLSIRDAIRARMAANLSLIAKAAMKHGRSQARVDASASWDQTPRWYAEASEWWFHEQRPRPRLSRWLRMLTCLTPQGLVVRLERIRPGDAKR